MLKIGITGGIGSGKTTVCQIFAALGIPVYYADDRAKWLMTNDLDLKNKIIDLFGSAAYLPDGALNRAHIGQLAFNDKNLLNQLNEAVHPAVFNDGHQWFNEQTTAYAIKEAALFYETGSYVQMDKMITVTAPEQIRIDRVMERDQTSAAEVKSRIDKQLPESEKVNKADFVIYNDGQKLLIPQVIAIHRTLLKEAALQKGTFF